MRHLAVSLGRGGEGGGPNVSVSVGLTFALRGVLGAIAEDVDLMHGSEGLEELFQFRFRPGPRDLSHKHLDGVRVGLVQVLQRPGHLDAVAIAAGQKQR